MIDNLNITFENFYKEGILSYLGDLQQNPLKIITLIIDLVIVIGLLYMILKIAKKTRAMQLLKGIVLLLVITSLSKLFNLNILNFILTSFTTYGVIALVVIFQPELRRALEQLGTGGMLSNIFGVQGDNKIKTKEMIYKVVIATNELSLSKTGGLIVIERDIKLNDIVSSGILMNAEISPQIIVNIFTPRTPLHDGALVITNHCISAVACILPLANDRDISPKLGTRHRAAIGISKETDAIAIVISEETGKISVAKDGTLIADIKEDVLRKILFKNLLPEEEFKENVQS